VVRINWTSQALDDLEAIWEFIARDAPRYAQLFANRIFEVVEQLRRSRIWTILNQHGVSFQVRIINLTPWFHISDNAL